MAQPVKPEVVHDLRAELTRIVSETRDARKESQTRKLLLSGHEPEEVVRRVQSRRTRVSIADVEREQQKLIRRYKRYNPAKIEQIVARELAKLDELEEVALRVLGEDEEVDVVEIDAATAKQTTKKASTERVAREVVYIDTMLRIMERRAKMLGLERGMHVHLPGSQPGETPVESMSDEELERMLREPQQPGELTQ